IHIDRLERGKMIRARAAASEAAGKGLNVSLALATEGVDTTAVLPLAADSATVYLGLLADAVPLTVVPVKGATRANVSLIKPNGAELEELVKRPLATVGDVVTAARELIARGCGAVLVSLGPDGAVFVDADTTAHAEASVDGVVNTVGAGDALLAGFLAAG